MMGGCHLKKGYEALEIYNFFEAKKRFDKSIDRKISPSAYGLSAIYFRTDNPFHNLDSAYHYSLLAVETYTQVDSLTHAKWNEKFNYKLSDAVELRNKVSEQFFQYAIDSNSVTAMKYFVAKNPWSPLKEEAIRLRDSLAYLNVSKVGTSTSYLRYLEQYPESQWKDEVISALHVAQFEETVVPGDIESYLEFLQRFPTNPYRKKAHERVYQLSTPNNTIEEYEVFIDRFEDSPYRLDAWRNLYRLSISNYEKDVILEFQQNHPDFPFPEMIDSDLALVGKELFLIKREGRYGFMNRDGEIMIPAQFEYASNFSNGLAVIAVQDKFGYIDKSGETVIECQFDEAQNFVEARAIVEINGFFGVIDPTGNYILNPEFDDIGVISEGLFYAEKNGFFQYFSVDGQLVINRKFSEAFSFENGKAKVVEDGVSGYIRPDGTFIVSSEKGDVRHFYDTMYVLQLRDSATFITPSGRLQFEYYDRIGGLKENRAIVAKKDKYGYVDARATVVIPLKLNTFPNYFQFAQFENGHALAYRQMRYALIDSTGKNILPAIFTGIGAYGELIPVSKGNGWGYTDKRVRLQIDYEYDYAYSFMNGLAIVEQDGLVGLIDLGGSLVTPLEFEDISREEDVYIYRKLGRFGLLNASGEVVLNRTFQRISKVQEGLLRLEDQSEIAYFDITKMEFITLKQ